MHADGQRRHDADDREHARSRRRLAEPLKADAGDDRVAEAGKPLTFDARGSRPAVGIERYRWTLQRRQPAETAPIVTHTFPTAGDQTATLTITAGTRDEHATPPRSPCSRRRPGRDRARAVQRQPGPRRRRARDPRRRPPHQRDHRQRRHARSSPACRTASRRVYAWAPQPAPRHGDDDRHRRRRQRPTITLAPGEVAQRRRSPRTAMTQRRDRRRGHQPGRPRQPRRSTRFEAHIAVDRRATRRQRRGVLRTASTAAAAAARRRCCGGGGGAYVTRELPGRRPAAAVARHPRPDRVPEGVLRDLDGRAEPGRAGVHAASDGTASLDLPGGPLARADDARRSRRASRSRTSRAAATRPRTGSSAATARAPTSRAPATPRRSTRSTCRSSLEARLADPIQRLRRVGDAGRGRHRRPATTTATPATSASASATSRRSTISNASLQIPVEGAKGYVAAAASSSASGRWRASRPGATWFPDGAGDPRRRLHHRPASRTGDVNLAESFITQAAGDSSGDRISISHAPAGAARRAGADAHGGHAAASGSSLKWDAGAGATGYQVYGAPDRTTEFGATPLPIARRADPGRGATDPATHRRSCAARARRRSRSRTVTPQPARAAPPDGRGDRRHRAATRRSRSTNREDVLRRQRRTLEVYAYDPDFNFSSITVSWPGGNVTRAVTGNDVHDDDHARHVPDGARPAPS